MSQMGGLENYFILLLLYYFFYFILLLLYTWLFCRISASIGSGSGPSEVTRWLGLDGALTANLIDENSSKSGARVVNLPKEMPGIFLPILKPLKFKLWWIWFGLRRNSCPRIQHVCLRVKHLNPAWKQLRSRMYSAHLWALCNTHNRQTCTWAIPQQRTLRIAQPM